MRQHRLAHIGVAAALAAATVTAIGLIQAVGAAGTASVFVPITPCRLIDTRAGDDNVGTRAAPIGSGEAATFQVTGTNGRCTIPATATGIATNATAVNATASSYVTFYPADASPRPTASNLNFLAGAPPTPNQVTVGLSAAGAIGVFNLSGTVDLIVDIVGYYQPGTGGGGPQGPKGDKGDPGTNGAPGPACPASGCTISFGASLVAQDVPSPNYTVDPVSSCVHIEPTGQASLSLSLPYGAKVTAILIRYSDQDAAAGGTNYKLFADNPVTRSNVSSSPFVLTSDSNVALSLVTAPLQAVSSTYQLLVFMSTVSTSDARQAFCGAEVTYTF